MNGILIALVLCTIIGIIYFILSDVYDRLRKKRFEINGVKFGENFKLLFEMDEIKVYVDLASRIVYLATEEGFTPLLGKEGKPVKYTKLEDVLKRK